MSAVELFAVVIAANMHCALAALGIREGIKSFRSFHIGERFVYCAGMAMMLGLPVVLAYRAMA